MTRSIECNKPYENWNHVSKVIVVQTLEVTFCPPCIAEITWTVNSAEHDEWLIGAIERALDRRTRRRAFHRHRERERERARRGIGASN